MRTDAGRQESPRRGSKPGRSFVHAPRAPHATRQGDCLKHGRGVFSGDSSAREPRRAGSGTIIDSPAQVGGYPAYASGVPPVDSDHDGMPDNWEREMGLAPEDPSDGTGDLDGDGYTNVEEYLHLLSQGG